jgi:hypothetical protein
MVTNTKPQWGWRQWEIFGAGGHKYETVVGIQWETVVTVATNARLHVVAIVTVVNRGDGSLVGNGAWADHKYGT